MASSIIKKPSKLQSTSKDKYLAQKPSSLNFNITRSKAKLSNLTPTTADAATKPVSKSVVAGKETLGHLQSNQEIIKKLNSKPILGSTVRKTNREADNAQANQEDLQPLQAGDGKTPEE